MNTLILLLNLGTPSAPTPKAVKKYLSEFLSDPRMIEIPKIFWWPLLHGLILTTRPKKSAQLYQKIWTDEGSPLMVGTKKLMEKLASCFHEKDNVNIDIAMRYGSPNIHNTLKKYRGINELIVISLYPQYASATTGSSLEAVMKAIETWRYIPSIKCINSYHAEPLYIEALAQSIQTFWQNHGRGQKLILSYHGLRKRSIEQGDPYFQQCEETTKLLAHALKLSSEDFLMVFQSRFGKAKWLEPYCTDVLKNLPAQGITSIDIICPGFSVDCLETLEEISIRNRALFLKAGGMRYHYIPCLNDSDGQIKLLCELVKYAST